MRVRKTKHLYLVSLAFSLPITDKNIHAFNYSIIIRGGNYYNLKINKDKLKVQYTVKINKSNADTHLFKFFKENVKPDKQYGIYLRPKNGK